MEQIVLDTNVIYAALRSKQGASYLLLSKLDSKKFKINLSVPLVLEYEDVLKRKIKSLTLSNSQIDELLNYLCLIANRHEMYFLWRPMLPDSKDDMVLELAIKSGSKYIVTYKKADFKGVEKFDIELVTSKEFLEIIEELP